jgi:ABC-type nitrate/sulfonate/bicarbonate transport system permease component
VFHGLLRVWKSHVQWLPSGVFLIILLAVWQLIVETLKIPGWLLPSPTQVLKAFGSTIDLLFQHSLTTIFETTTGFIISIILGLCVGLLMDLFPLVKRTLYPYLIFSQTVPLIAIAPLLILWLGYGLLPKIMTVILVCFFPISVSLVEGLENSDPDLMNLLKSMGATRWQILFYVRWPNAMPSLFSGLKISATYSVMAAVVGEWLGASSGLGVYLTRASHSFLTDRVFAAILSISLLSLLYFALISLLGRWILPWSYPKKDDNT